MDKTKLSILLAVIGAIGAVGGGSYALDFSNTQTTNTNTDNSQTIINEGDTIINEIIEEYVDPNDLIDYGYDYYCEEVAPESEECDWYWEDFE